MNGIKDKIVIVTGAGGGLGRATAALLARSGAHLALTDLDESSLEQTREQVDALGARVVARSGNAADPATASAIVDAALEAFGGIGGVCNIAGINGVGMIEDISPELFSSVMETNCLSQILTIKYAVPALRRSHGAAIVNVASVGALIGLPCLSVYCASKAAILGLTKALALELAPDIRCNAICPGGIDTPMSQKLLAGFDAYEREAMLAKLLGRQLIKRFARPEEIARSIIYLLSDEAVFVTGTALSAEGGATAW